MKRILFAFIALSFLNSSLFAQNIPAYQIYDSLGNPVSYQQMIKQLAKADVVFYGELHNNPIAHWLELEITKSLYKEKNGKIIQGAEMFESDVQLIINEYLQGFIREKDVKNEARVWPNYTTDYRPLLVFAHDHNLPFIATNIPRRYANLVYRKGLDELNKLPDASKKYIAPLPIKYDSNLACYKKMVDGMVNLGMPANPNIAKAQAIKDATMAYHIAQHLTPNSTFIHYNGSYHSDYHQGIVWYLRIYAPQAKILTISTVEQNDVTKLNDSNKKIADFIVVVPSDMTKTY